MEIKNITHQDVAYHDKRFFVPSHGDREGLERSIREFGLINPPVVTARAEGWVVVCGWRRLTVCRSLPEAGLQVLVDEERDDGRLFRRAVEENAIVRPFNELEKAWVLAKFKAFGLPDTDLIREINPFLGLPAAKWSLEAYLSFKNLEPEIQSVVTDKNLSRQALQALAELDEAERAEILPLLAPLGGNKIRELCEDLHEVAGRRRVSGTVIMDDPEIRDVMNSPKLSVQQKADHIRLMIKNMRYPKYVSWKRRMEATLRKVGWPEDVDFVPTAYFEDENISLKMRFGRLEELRAKLRVLMDTIEHEAFIELMENPSHD